MYEQVFLKEGGETRRTPWHQDASYLPVGGADTAVAWITFDPISKEDSLEFVKGSHKDVLYNTSRFELGDDTAPINERSNISCSATYFRSKTPEPTNGFRTAFQSSSGIGRCYRPDRYT
jgi:ectoine hydroxylase-related dioxygenase (phytanoyl-CoA dioxygenase family)